MITRIDPPLPVRTPKGTGLAHFLIDYGIENDLLWICFQDETGECWTWNNKMIRAQKNITQGREKITPFYNPDDVFLSNTDEPCRNRCFNTKKENRFEGGWKCDNCESVFYTNRIKE